MSNCTTKNCENEAVTKSGVCARCYKYIWHWMKKGPTKAHRHGVRLQRREELLDIAMGSNVRSLRRRA